MGAQQYLRATFTKGAAFAFVVQVIADAGAFEQSLIRLITLFQCWARECRCVF